jgi:hypothetical protein
MKTLKLFTLLTIVAVLLSSCGNKKGKTGDVQEEEFNLQKYIELANEITPNMNDIGQYLKALDLVKAKYYPELAHDPYKAPEYKTSFPHAAAMLGVYSIDIVYHAYGDDIDAGYLSFAAAQELARYVGVEGAFAVTTFDAFEGTAGSRDSIALMYNNLLKESENYANEGEILFVNTAYLIGGYTEKMHIMSSLIQQKLNAETLSQEEEISLKQLIVVYADRLKAAGSLLSAIEIQIDHFQTFLIPDQFFKLNKLATSIEATEAEILEMPLEKIKESELLKESFQIVSNIRTMLVTASK